MKLKKEEENVISKEQEAYNEWKDAVLALVSLEEEIQAAQKRFGEAQRKLQLAALGKSEA